jgi:hypothetical protein
MVPYRAGFIPGDASFFTRSGERIIIKMLPDRPKKFYFFPSVRTEDIASPKRGDPSTQRV